MGWATGTAVYLVIWWLVIFMVLPWGARSVIDEDDVKKGDAPGAPKKPRMLLKVAITTVISGALWGIVYTVIESGVISFRE
jgi:predicted secreted protein